MKNAYPYIPYLIGYVAILLINTSQLVGLYVDLVGEDGVGVSPWLSLFALDLAILLLSFRKPDWERLSPPAIFAFAIGILDLLFFVGRMDSVSWESLLPAVLFSACFAYGIYYMAEELASIHEEQASKRQELASAIENARKEIEEGLKEREELVKIGEEALKESERKADQRERELKGIEKKLKGEFRYGNSVVRIDLESDPPKLVKV